MQMPKQNHTSAAPDTRNRTNRRASEKRLDLLSKILDESSSISASSAQLSARQTLESNLKLLDLIEQLKQEESSINPTLPRRSPEKWKEFFQWVDVKSTKIKMSERVNVAAKPQHESEFGLVTKVPFKKGDILLDIHRSLMLSTETVRDDSSLYCFIVDDPIASSMPNVALVLHLLNEHSKGDKSAWRPYLSILPDKILPVLSMTRDKLELLLASSHIFELLKMIRAISRQYSYFYKRLQATRLPLARDFTFEYYCWGVSTVCSRQNEIPPADRIAHPRPVNALIPVLDMCNHDRQSKQATFEKDSSLLLSSGDLLIGDEITINYGNRSSGEFYIHNGFVPDDVPFDIVPITITLNQDSIYVTKVKLLEILNMPPFGRFKLIYNDHKYRHKRDPLLTMFLIVYFLTEDELDHIMDSSSPVSIADRIYEYIQYGQDQSGEHARLIMSHAMEEQAKPTERSADDDNFDINVTKKRLASSIKEYLSKRASISVALIDRTLNGGTLNDKDAALMLQHERSIFESYLLNSKS